jgi:hypothetical protein
VVDLATLEHVQDPTGAFGVDGPRVCQRVSYHEVFGGDAVTIERMLKDPFGYPLARGAGLAKPAPG